LICQQFSEEQLIDHSKLLNKTEGEVSTEITSALLDNENHQLHRWDDKNVFVQPKENLDPKEVTQTILNLRRLLIKKKIEGLSDSIKENIQDSHLEVLSETLDYKKLEMLISNKIGRVV
jgi:DNA primase